MKTQNCRFAGRGRNSAVFMMNWPRLNPRNRAAPAVSVSAENGCLRALGTSWMLPSLWMKDLEDEFEFFGSSHAQSFFSLDHNRCHAMQTSDWGTTAEAKILRRRKQENQFCEQSKVAKSCFELDWTYKAFWTPLLSCRAVILLLLISLRFLLL